MNNDFGVYPGDYAKLRDEIARLTRNLQATTAERDEYYAACGESTATLLTARSKVNDLRMELEAADAARDALEKISGALAREIHEKPCEMYYTEMIASLERELAALKSANVLNTKGYDSKNSECVSAWRKAQGKRNE